MSPQDPALASNLDASDPHVAGSIPPWVHINDNDEKAPFLTPEPAIPNDRHYRPPPRKYELGRKWDKDRTAEPGLLSAPIADEQTRWISFMQSGPNPREYRGAGIIRSPEWMADNVPVFRRQWEEEDDRDPEAATRIPGGFQGIMYRGKWLISPERQEKTVRLFWRLLLKNAFVPLVFRLTCLMFSTAALGVSVTIWEKVQEVNNDNDQYNQCAPRASTYMGIIVDTVAIPYIAYVTWDEYMSKPLGLRSVATKTLLLLCDLYFIVFSASNLSLAMEALIDSSWACYDESSQQIGNEVVAVSKTCPNNSTICYRQRALTGVLFISLVAWLLCFSVSVLRVVEKLRLDY